MKLILRAFERLGTQNAVIAVIAVTSGKG